MRHRSDHESITGRWKHIHRTPWSKRKKEIESLFTDGLKLAIHATSMGRGHDAIPVYRMALAGETIWSFPAPFIYSEGKKEARLPEIEHYWCKDCDASMVLDEYVDRPRDMLFEPIKNDDWELGDMLRAADRRIGKGRLLEWAKTLHPENPALLILKTRFQPPASSIPAAESAATSSGSTTQPTV